MKKTIKNTKIILLAAASLSLSIFSACDKHDDDHHHDATDKDAPVITLSSPTSMQVFYSGDTVWIKGTLTDASLHELLINIRKDSDSSILFTTAPTVHDLTSFNINSFWKSSVTGHTNATVEVIAEDHSGNSKTVKTAIHIMP